MNDNEYLTAQEIADKLRVDRRTVNNWIIQGKLPAIKLGDKNSHYRVKILDFEEFMKGLSRN